MRSIALVTIGLAVAAAACTGAGASPSPTGGTGGTLIGPAWILASYVKAGVSTAVPPGITADAVFKTAVVSGSSGCNAYTGPYTAQGSTIKAGPFAATQMACPGPSGDVEQAFIAGMANAATYTATADSLTLYDPSGAATLVFKAGTAGVLAGPTWHLLAYNNGKGAVQSAAAGSDATATFAADGTVSGNATCNQYNGPYTTNADTIKIGPLVSTKMACSSDNLNAQETAYLATLQNAATYTVEGTNLELRDANGALQAQYVSR
jgi:heat shock protein HslJ